MDDLTNFVAGLPDWVRFAYLAVIFLLCWAWEAAAPLVAFSYRKVRHAIINLAFLIPIAVLQLLSVGAITVVAMWGETNSWGLLYLVTLPPILEFLIAILVLDFVVQYCMHYALHHVKWMWRLHMAHHADTHVDATTGTRLHPFDYLSREVASLLVIGLFGVPLAHYLLYRLMTMFFTYVTHANVRLPKGVDRALSGLFVTPDVHKFHHHQQAPWTDSNFGNVLSVWDRLFGTFVYDDTRQIRYGLDVLDDGRDLDYLYQMVLPWDQTISTNGRPGLFQRYANPG